MEMPHRKLLLGQQQREHHKHYSRICEKTFSHRKELQEHMRTHVVNGEHIPNKVKDPTIAGEECDSAGEIMHAVRTNPNRHRTNLFCENCGKEFVSRKLHLEHDRCSSVKASVVGDEDNAPNRSSPSSSQSCYKNKRACRDTKVNSNIPLVHLLTKEEDLAQCLVMLFAHKQVIFIANTEDSSPSASNQVDDRHEPPSEPPSQS